MSPQKKTNSNVLRLETIYIGCDDSVLYDLDPSQATLLEQHIKSTAGGSLVSICL
jgi:hypothetical protein